MDKSELLEQSLKKIGRRVETLRAEEQAAGVDLSDYRVAERVFEWLDFLTRRMGATRTNALFARYEQIGVISPAMRGHFETYLRGISSPKNAPSPELSIEEQEKSLELLNAIYDQARR